MSSRALKQVDWCLLKASKEIEDSKKHNRKIRHKGLLKIEPDKKLALGHVEKARHNLKMFRLLRENKFSDWCITMGFYVLYHCFLAIVVKKGYESKNQTCTIALIELLQEQGEISINQNVIDFMKYNEEKNGNEESLIDLREDYTYGVDLEIKDEQQLDKIEKLCVEFIEDTRDIVYGDLS